MLLKTTRTAILTVSALNLLAQDDEHGCCVKCCAVCWVLEDMYKSGDLDDIVRKAPADMREGASWWDSKNQAVNQVWLLEQWSYECPNHPDEDD